MAKIALELDEETHQLLFDIQNDRRKKKQEPTAINKIAAEILTKAVKEYQKGNPSK